MLKRYILAIIALMLCFTVQSQVFSRLFWVDATLRYGYGTSILFNPNILYDSDVSIKYLNRCEYYGGSLGIKFTEEWSMGVDLMTQHASMGWGINTGGQNRDIRYSKTVKFEFLEVGIRGRYTFGNGLFIELGLKQDILQSVSVSNDVDIASKMDTISNPSLKFNDLEKDAYRQATLSAVGGIGLTIIDVLNERLKVTFGLKFSYSFGDFTNDQVDTPLTDGIFTQNPSYGNRYQHPYPVRLFTGMAQLELTYIIGYLGKSNFNKKKFKFR